MRYLLALLVTINSVSAQTWTSFSVGVGIKSGLSVNSSGIPVIAYMTENSGSGGYIRVGQWQPNGTFDTTTVATGYYYGPLDITLDQSESPHIVTHFHNGSVGNSDLVGELFHVWYDGIWNNEVVADTNHDGWDADIRIDDMDHIHVASLDPPGFSHPPSGIEYSYYNGTFWSTEAVGTPVLNYANATSLDLDSTNDPHITYYDDINQRLSYVYKKSATWYFEIIDSIGDPGRFSYLVLDDNSIPHISYTNRVGNDTSLIIYAWNDGSGWQSEVVDTLFNLNISFSGARKSTALQIDNNGDIHIAYCDKKLVKIANRISIASWSIDTIIDESLTSVVLGQQIDFAIDNNNESHITYHELSSFPAPGIIKYATTSTTITSTSWHHNQFEVNLIPNISDQTITIVSDEQLVYYISNSVGVRISHENSGRQLDVSQLPSGLYYVHFVNEKGQIAIKKFIRP